MSVALIFDIIVVGIFVLCILHSMRQGFIKSVSAIVSIVLTIVLMFAFQDSINTYLRESDFGIAVNEKITDALLKDGFDDKDTNETEELKLPGFLKPIIEETQKTVDDTKNSLLEETANGVTTTILNVLSILLLFVIVKILLFFALKILDIIFKLPLLKSVNKIAGVAVGAINALFIIYILCAGLIWFGLNDVTSEIGNTFIAQYFYNNNILLDLFM